MTYEWFVVSRYLCQDYSSLNLDRSRLVLIGEKKERCVVHFMVNESLTLKKPKRVAEKIYHFYYYQSHLHHLIDMLRNEKPMYVVFKDQGGSPYGYIGTSYEPVGEGEYI